MSAAAEPELTPRRIAAFLVMVVGMFMAILDIQIVSASLAEIQAGLAASPDEISWVQTSYLIAEVIMIPLSAFLARMMSTKTLFTLSAAGFTVSSFLCATSGSINEMIIWRALQGFLGGGMIPSVFAAAFTIFPASKRNIVSPMIGLIATLAPTVGPTVGGYLSHTMSWHWLFLVNVIPGIGVTLGAFFLIDFDRPNWKLFHRFDWWGLAALAAFLGGLEYVLEEGASNDWFQDRAVAAVAVIMVVGGGVSFWRALTRDEPIVDLSAFTNINFAIGSAFSFVMGIGLYGLTYLYPLYLGSIRGYDSLMIGETVFVSGLAMFATAPLAGFLASKVDLRLMLLLGFLGFGASTWMLTGLTDDWDFHELLWPQILRGMSLMLSMVPINNLALSTLTPDKNEGRIRAFQPDAKPWRRGRTCRDQYDPVQPGGSALCAVERGDQLVQQRSHAPTQLDGGQSRRARIRRPDRRAYADGEPAQDTGDGDVIHRRVCLDLDAIRKFGIGCVVDAKAGRRGRRRGTLTASWPLDAISSGGRHGESAYF